MPEPCFSSLAVYTVCRLVVLAHLVQGLAPLPVVEARGDAVGV